MLDLPSAWGTNYYERGAPAFASCTGAESTPAEDIVVHAERCSEGDSGAACVRRAILGHSQPTYKTQDLDSDPLLRWVAMTVELPDRQWTDTLYVYDEAHRAVVTCGYSQSRAPESFRKTLRDVCGTLAPAPADATVPGG